MTNRNGFHPDSSEVIGTCQGASLAPYDSLNLGLKVGDTPDLVQANRRSVALLCGLEEILFMDQVHSARFLDGRYGGEQVCDGIFLRRESLKSERTGLAVQVADCVPMVIEHPTIIAAVHIGREGLVKGMTESAIDTLAKEIDLGEAKAWLGPSICGSCYPVSEEMFAECEARYPLTVHSRAKREIDVAGGVISILNARGVQWDWFAGKRECVSCDSSYFSYRRDRVTGRQAMIVAW